GPKSSSKDLPPGDAASGAALFKLSVNGAPACSTCHTVDGTSGVGPTLKGFSATAGTRISNTSARDYAYQSVTSPASYIVSGFSNVMYGKYAQHLDPQQISDLISYLLPL